MDFIGYHSPKVTMVTAGVLGLLYVVLSFRVVANRFKGKVSLGLPSDTSHPLFVAGRVHGNFQEYVPLMLILQLLLESTGGATSFLIAGAVVMVLGRLLVWAGISDKRAPNWKRVSGNAMTFTLIVVYAAMLISRGLA